MCQDACNKSGNGRRPDIDKGHRLDVLIVGKLTDVQYAAEASRLWQLLSSFGGRTACCACAHVGVTTVFSARSGWNVSQAYILPRPLPTCLSSRTAHISHDCRVPAHKHEIRWCSEVRSSYHALHGYRRDLTFWVCNLRRQAQLRLIATCGLSEYGCLQAQVKQQVNTCGSGVGTLEGERCPGRHQAEAKPSAAGCSRPLHWLRRIVFILPGHQNYDSVLDLGEVRSVSNVCSSQCARRLSEPPFAARAAQLLCVSADENCS